MSNNPVISVVVPVFNEQGNIPHLLERLNTVFEKLELTHEFILVDDGSSDGSWVEIVEQTNKYSSLVGMRLSRNFGHQHALLAGLRRAKGDAVISMDGDLQHPPELLPELVEAWQRGAQVVLTERTYPQKTSWWKKTTSRYFYSVYSFLAETPLSPGASDFRLLSKKALNALLQYRHAKLFLRGAIANIGFPAETVSFEADERFQGDSKYSLKKMVKFAASGLLSQSTFPLRLGIWIGMFTGVLGLVQLGYVLMQFWLGNTVPGWASTVALTSILFSVLFFILGLLGLYVEDIHKLLKNHPHFIIENEVSGKPDHD